MRLLRPPPRLTIAVSVARRADPATKLIFALPHAELIATRFSYASAIPGGAYGLSSLVAGPRLHRGTVAPSAPFRASLAVHALPPRGPLPGGFEVRVLIQLLRMNASVQPAALAFRSCVGLDPGQLFGESHPVARSRHPRGQCP